jgi:hypothetical protein
MLGRAALVSGLISLAVGCGGSALAPASDGGRDSGAAGAAGSGSGAAGSGSGAAGAAGTGAAGSGMAGTGASGSGAAGASGAPGACADADCGAKPHSLPFCPNGAPNPPICAHAADGSCAWMEPSCPAACPALGCNPFCVAGFKLDANGCPTCTCNPTPGPVCGPVCDIFCQYGNVLDANGCPTCKCNPPPACTDKDCGPVAPWPPRMCADGSIVSSATCARDATGTCAWHLDDCPPASCACPAGQVCVQQIGGPAVAAPAAPPPPPKCETPNAACVATVDAQYPSCACLAAADGICKGGTAARTCTCDNGVR